MAAQNCLVIGAGSGIGLATALELAGRGFAVTLVARDRAALDAARQRCLQAGAASATSVAADVNDAAALELAVAEATSSGRSLDLVVHTAAVMAYGRLDEMPVDVFTTVVDTAIHGTMNVARAVLPVLQRQQTGVFVIVNSLLGSVTVPNMGAYATSKWGQRAVARTIQQEMRAHKNVHVCIVSPGSINTPIYYQAANYLGREARPPIPVLQPERAGRIIADLLDRPRRHVSIPIGPTNPVIITGYRLLPRLFDLIVGPAFQVGALTRSKRQPDTGSVFTPAAERERMHGRWPDTPS